MAQCMESGIAPASSCGMKVGRSPRDRRNGREKVGAASHSKYATSGLRKPRE